MGEIPVEYIYIEDMYIVYNTSYIYIYIYIYMYIHEYVQNHIYIYRYIHIYIYIFQIYYIYYICIYLNMYIPSPNASSQEGEVRSRTWKVRMGRCAGR